MPSGKYDYRAKHRARAHEAAHAEAEPAHEMRIPDHVPAYAGKADLIETDEALAGLLADLRAAGSFAYDSEFIGESSYHPRLCLLQVATTTRVSLIDPLAKVDLTPFWNLLSDASVEKIVHAGAQDVEPVARLTGQPVRNALDTQIAAGFCAMAYPTSLAKLVLELTGIALQKGLTFTFWEQRPLSNKQMRYAADDVRYLPAAMIELKKRLDKTGHINWVRAECDLLCNPANYGFNPDTAIEKVRGAGSLDARQLNVLKELVLWRDAAARAADLPARSYLRDDVLVELCRSFPKKPEQLNRVRGLPNPVIAEHGEAILGLVATGIAAPTEGVDLLRGVEPTPSERFTADAMWAAAQAICISQSIDPAVVTSRQEIGHFHRHLIDGTDPSELRLAQSWRREALCDRLIDIYRNKTPVNLTIPT